MCLQMIEDMLLGDIISSAIFEHMLLIDSWAKLHVALYWLEYVLSQESMMESSKKRVRV